MPELQKLRETRAGGNIWDLYALAEKAKRPAADVNQALDALIGRTEAEAAAILNRTRSEAPSSGQWLQAFLKEMFR